MSTHQLIYFAANEAVGKNIHTDLKGKGYALNEWVISESTGKKLNEIDLGAPESAIVLLITDNFLKSANCMEGALTKVKKWANSGWLIPVVADGVGENGEVLPTNFERVTNIIPYMNHWQDKYLELRRKKRTEEEDPVLDAEITLTKSISSDMGELLRFLRNVEHYALAEFQTNDYAAFRMALGEDLPEAAAETTNQSLVEMIEGSSQELMAENPGSNPEPIPTETSDVEVEEDIPEGVLDNIPGMDLLKDAGQTVTDESDPADDPGLDAEASALMDELLSQQPSAPPPAEEEEMEEDEDEDKPAEGLLMESDDTELNSILDEMLAEEGMGIEEEEEFEFVSDDPENPDDFNLDALLDDEDETDGQTTSDEEEAINENEVSLDLLTDEDEELVNMENGKISPDEILDHALDLFAEGETKEGLSHLGDAVENNPGNTTLRYYFAYAQARYAQKPKKARKQLETLLHQDPEHPEAWYLMGELAENQEDYSGAIRCFEKAVEIHPTYPDIHYRLGILTVQYFQGKEEKAAAHFEEAIQQNEENVDAHYALANLLNEQLGQPEKAITHFEKVLELEPAHHFANYDLALLHHKMGNTESATEFYQKATAIDPDLKTEANDLAFGIVIKEAMEEMLSDEEPEEKIETPDEKTEAEETTTEAPKEEPEPAPPGPIVLITGGTAGIGRATAEVFAREGYRVIITGRRADRLDEIKNNFSETYSSDIQTLNFDVRDAGAVLSALKELPDDWRNVDILINNAGLSRGLSPIQEGNIEDWDTMIDTNVKGLLYLTRAIAPQMVARRSGHIINIASSAGKEVYPGGNVYCATKSAVEALTKSMRIDLHQHNVRVSQVAPGHVEETEFARVRFDGDMERAEKTYENFQPLKSSDVAEVIYFIATRPAHVNIQDVFMFGTQQAGSNFIDRSGR